MSTTLGLVGIRSLVGFVSAHVFTLVNGALQAMFGQQLKLIAVGTCGLGLLAAGGTTHAYQLVGKPDPKGAAKVAVPAQAAQNHKPAKPAPAIEQTSLEANLEALDKANSEGEIAQMKLKLLRTRLQNQQQIVYDLEFDPSPIFVRRGANLIVLPEQATAEELKKVRDERGANLEHARRLLKTLEERFDAVSHEIADAKRRAEAIKARLKAVQSGLKTVGTHAPGRDSTPAALGMSGDAPTDEEVWLKVTMPGGTTPPFYETKRNNVRIVTEKMGEKVDPVRIFPLAGPCNLVHCRYKSTVQYDESYWSDYPIPFNHIDHRVEVVYIDKDHLRRADRPASATIAR